MKRKLLAVAMTLAMTAGMLAGCSGGSKAPETKAPETTTTAAAAETTKAAETTTAAAKNRKERRSFNRCCHADQGFTKMESGWLQHEERTGSCRL